MVTAPDRQGSTAPSSRSVSAAASSRPDRSFLTILRRQRDDAVGHGQEDRVELLDGFLKEIDGEG